jgi:hypothetical protein
MDWGAMSNGGAVFNFCTSSILPFSIISIILLRRNKFALLPLLLPVLYFFFFSMIFMGHPRFRFPVEPFLLILASYGIVWLFNRFSNKTITAGFIFSWLGINLFLFINSGYVKEIFKGIFTASGLW